MKGILEVLTVLVLIGVRWAKASGHIGFNYYKPGISDLASVGGVRGILTLGLPKSALSTQSHNPYNRFYPQQRIGSVPQRPYHRYPVQSRRPSFLGTFRQKDSQRYTNPYRNAHIGILLNKKPRVSALPYKPSNYVAHYTPRTLSPNRYKTRLNPRYPYNYPSSRRNRFRTIDTVRTNVPQQRYHDGQLAVSPYQRRRYLSGPVYSGYQRPLTAPPPNHSVIVPTSVHSIGLKKSSALIHSKGSLSKPIHQTPDRPNPSRRLYQDSRQQHPKVSHGLVHQLLSSRNSKVYEGIQSKRRQSPVNRSSSGRTADYPVPPVYHPSTVDAYQQSQGPLAGGVHSDAPHASKRQSATVLTDYHIPPQVHSTHSHQQSPRVPTDYPSPQAGHSTNSHQQSSRLPTGHVYSIPERAHSITSHQQSPRLATDNGYSVPSRGHSTNPHQASQVNTDYVTPTAPKEHSLSSRHQSQRVPVDHVDPSPPKGYPINYQKQSPRVVTDHVHPLPPKEQSIDPHQRFQIVKTDHVHSFPSKIHPGSPHDQSLGAHTYDVQPTATREHTIQSDQQSPEVTADHVYAIPPQGHSTRSHEQPPRVPAANGHPIPLKKHLPDPYKQYLRESTVPIHADLSTGHSQDNQNEDVLPNPTHLVHSRLKTKENYQHQMLTQPRLDHVVKASTGSQYSDQHRLKDSSYPYQPLASGAHSTVASQPVNTKSEHHPPGTYITQPPVVALYSPGHQTPLVPSSEAKGAIYDDEPHRHEQAQHQPLFSAKESTQQSLPATSSEHRNHQLQSHKEGDHVHHQNDHLEEAQQPERLPTKHAYKSPLNSENKQASLPAIYGRQPTKSFKGSFRVPLHPKQGNTSLGSHDVHTRPVNVPREHPSEESSVSYPEYPRADDKSGHTLQHLHVRLRTPGHSQFIPSPKPGYLQLVHDKPKSVPVPKYQRQAKQYVSKALQGSEIQRKQTARDDGPHARLFKRLTGASQLPQSQVCFSDFMNAFSSRGYGFSTASYPSNQIDKEVKTIEDRVKDLLTVDRSNVRQYPDPAGVCASESRNLTTFKDRGVTCYIVSLYSSPLHVHMCTARTVSSSASDGVRCVEVLEKRKVMAYCDDNVIGSKIRVMEVEISFAFRAKQRV